MIRLLVLTATLAGLAAAPARASDVSLAGQIDAPAPSGGMGRAADAAVDSEGNAYVLFGAYVRKYDAGGALVGTWGGVGDGPGLFRPRPAPYARFGPLAIDVDDRHVYVADVGGDRLVVFGRDGRFVANWGEGLLDAPEEVAVERTGTVIAGSGISADAPAIVRFDSTGATLARAPLEDAIDSLTAGVDGAVHVRGGRERVDTLDPVTLRPATGFDLLPPFPPAMGKAGPPAACCGIAAVGDSLWIGRAYPGRLERYSTDGTLLATCGILGAGVYAFGGAILGAFSGLADELVAGRDGTLYLLRTGAGTARLLRLRIDDPAAPACTEPPPGPPAPPARPAISRARIKLDDRTVSLVRRRALGRLRLVYSLTLPARLTVRLDRAVAGRRVHGRCLPARRSPDLRGHCLAFVRRASVELPEAQPRTRYEYSLGRMIRRRAGRPGLFQLTLVAQDETGASSPATRLVLRVLG